MPPCSTNGLRTVRHAQGKALPTHTIYIFGQEVVLLEDLLKLMEIVENGPGATCQYTLTVQIGSKLRGNIGWTVKITFQPGLP